MKFSLFDLFLLILVLIISTVFSQRTDCEILNQYLNRKLDTACCGIKKEDCDSDNYIQKIELTSKDLLNVDLNKFPRFDRLRFLTIQKENLNIIPENFFNLPILEKLKVYDSNITQIPKNFNQKSPLTEIDLGNNQISEFPYEFNKLPNIKRLFLAQNKISGSVDLKDFSKYFKQIDLTSNNIDKINNIPERLEVLRLSYNKGINEVPIEIPNLPLLKELELNGTSITELPPNLFKLEHLQRFHISENPQLKPNIIKFGNGNSIIKDCSFDLENIGCYQSGTCNNINSALIKKDCDNSQINEIKNKQTETKTISEDDLLEEEKDKSNENSNSTTLIVIGIIIIILLVLLIGAIFYRKNNSSSENKSVNNNITKENSNTNNNNTTKENNNNNNNNNNNLTTNSTNELNISQNDISSINNMSFISSPQLSPQLPIVSQNNLFSTPGMSFNNNSQFSMMGSNNFYPTTGITMANNPLSMVGQNNFLPVTTSVISNGNNSQFNNNHMSLLTNTSLPLMNSPIQNSTISMIPMSSPIQNPAVLPMSSTIQNNNMTIVAPVRVEYDIQHTEDLTKSDLPPPYSNDGVKTNFNDSKFNLELENQLFSQNQNQNQNQN